MAYEMYRYAKIRPMLNGTDRPIAAVWLIWSENGQTRKRHAYQLYGGGNKLNKLCFWAVNYMPTCKSDTDITMGSVCESVSCE